MKKILAMTLAVVMLLCLTACGNGDNDTTTAPTEVTTTPTTEATTAPTTEATEAPTTEATEAPTETTLEADPELLLAMGANDGMVYTNEMFGVTFTLPEEWMFASEEQMAVISGLAESTYDDTVVGELIANSGTAMIMYATSSLGLPNVNININRDETIDFDNMDAYITMTAGLMPTMLESSGMTVSNLETKRVTFAGEDRLCIVYDLEYNGVAMSQLVCFMAGENGYLATITITTSTAEEIDGVVAAFAAIG